MGGWEERDRWLQEGEAAFRHPESFTHTRVCLSYVVTVGSSSTCQFIHPTRSVRLVGRSQQVAAVRRDSEQGHKGPSPGETEGRKEGWHHRAVGGPARTLPVSGSMAPTASRFSYPALTPLHPTPAQALRRQSSRLHMLVPAGSSSKDTLSAPRLRPQHPARASFWTPPANGSPRWAPGSPGFPCATLQGPLLSPTTRFPVSPTRLGASLAGKAPLCFSAALQTLAWQGTDNLLLKVVVKYTRSIKFTILTICKGAAQWHEIQSQCWGTRGLSWLSTVLLISAPVMIPGS